jgi:1-acyl-sn-glycerol-3-phosphate acyltransferase
MKNNKILLVISSFIKWIIAVLYMIVWTLTLMLTATLFPPKIYDPILKFGCKIVLFIVGVKTRVVNKEKINPTKRYIFMANHTNILDHFVIYSSIPQKGRGLEKASHFLWPFYGWALKAIKMIPIPSEKGTGRTKKVYLALQKASAYIRRHKWLSVIIMPEGTRTRDGKIGMFRRGGFLLAIKTKIPIIPMTINGLYNIQQKGGFLIRSGKVDVLVHEPVETKNLREEDSTVLMKQVREVIVSRHRLELDESKC